MYEILTIFGGTGRRPREAFEGQRERKIPRNSGFFRLDWVKVEIPTQLDTDSGHAGQLSERSDADTIARRPVSSMALFPKALPGVFSERSDALCPISFIFLLLYCAVRALPGCPSGFLATSPGERTDLAFRMDSP